VQDSEALFLEEEHMSEARRSVIQVALLAVLLSLLAAGVAVAQEVTVFGIKQYTKPKGAPVSFDDTFKAPLELNDFRIYVKSGTGARDDVKNFTVLLNGEEVVTARDLTGGEVVKPVTLQSVNTLTVDLKGAEGRSIFVGILGNYYKPQY
jgi:hypothetical protein